MLKICLGHTQERTGEEIIIKSLTIIRITIKKISGQDGLNTKF